MSLVMVNQWDGASLLMRQEFLNVCVKKLKENSGEIKPFWV